MHCPPRFLVAAVSLLALLVAPRAEAGIIGGPIMMGPPPVLGPNPIGETEFYGFHEQQNVILDRDLKLGKMKRAGVRRKAAPKVKLERGTLVSSHYLLYDPAEMVRHSLTIEFDSEILGVVVKGKKLKKTDFLGVSGVDYKKFPHRGWETRDRYEISADGRTITFHFRANNPGDYIRVITAGRLTPPPPAPPPFEPPIEPTPVPEPGAALLFGLGAGLVRFFTGRRSRPSR